MLKKQLMCHYEINQYSNAEKAWIRWKWILKLLLNGWKTAAKHIDRSFFNDILKRDMLPNNHFEVFNEYFSCNLTAYLLLVYMFLLHLAIYISWCYGDANIIHARDIFYKICIWLSLNRATMSNWVEEFGPRLRKDLINSQNLQLIVVYLYWWRFDSCVI